MAKNTKHKTVHLTAATVFTIVTFVHALRLANQWPLVIGTWAAPPWLSWLAVFITGTLAAMLWKTA